MVLLLDRYAKWQMAALASHYTKAPVFEMAAAFHDASAFKARLIPLAFLPALAACLVYEVLPLQVLLVATCAATIAYCVICYRGWMALIREAQKSHAR